MLRPALGSDGLLVLFLCSYAEGIPAAVHIVGNMQTTMLLHAHYLKILNCIIESIAILVMDDLLRG